MEKNKLAFAFLSSLEAIASELLVFCGLTYRQDVEALANPLLRWLDFRLRFVDPMPRQVSFSDRFPKDLPSGAAAALSAFEKAVVNGEDINRFQSKGLTRHHDTSARNRRDRTDHLWADWGILHFHLTTDAPTAGQYYSPRADWRLFAAFFRDWAAFIDVRPHAERRSLENSDLVRILIRNWPTVAELYRLKGILPPPTSVDSETIKRLRIGGISNPVVIDGVTYMPPGLGVTTASTSTKVSMKAIEVHRAVRALASLVADPNGQFQAGGANKVGQNVAFTLSLTPRGLGIYEESTDTCWLLPRPTQSGAPTAFEVLNDLIAPEWLCAEISNKLNGSTASV